MGRDKGALVLDGRRLVEHALAALRPVVARVLLASGSAPRYPELGLECVLDPVPGWGPLSGLEAGLARMESAGVAHACVLACDMPRAHSAALARLLEHARTGAAEVVLASTPRGKEPLFGVYAVRTLEAVRRARARGAHRLDAFHDEVRVETVPESELVPGCTHNVNTPADLEVLVGGRA